MTSLTLLENCDFFLETIYIDETASSTFCNLVHSDTPRVGEVWMTTGDNGPRHLVLVTQFENDLGRAILVTTTSSVDIATNDDVLVMEEDNDTGGAPYMLCIWRDMPITRQTLCHRTGIELPDSIIQATLMLLQNSLTGGFIRRPFKAEYFPTCDEWVVRWSIQPKDGGPVYEYRTGAPVIREGDPRLKIREELTRVSSWIERSGLSDI